MVLSLSFAEFEREIVLGEKRGEKRDADRFSINLCLSVVFVGAHRFHESLFVGFAEENDPRLPRLLFSALDCESKGVEPRFFN